MGQDDNHNAGPRIGLNEFWKKSPEEKYAYVQSHLHLQYFALCSGKDVENGEHWLIARVYPEIDKDSGCVYRIYPMDLGSSSRPYPLFKDRIGSVPSWIELRDKDDVMTAVAAEACAWLSDGWGTKLVCVQYGFASEQDSRIRLPLTAEKMELLEFSPKDMDSRIDEVQKLIELEKQLYEIKSKLRTAKEQLYETKSELQTAKEQLEKAQLEAARASSQKDEFDAILGSLKEKALAFGHFVADNGLALDDKERDFLRECELLSDLRQPESMHVEQLPTQGTESDTASRLPRLAAQVRDAIFQNQRLAYDEYVIREFLGAMFTDQIIILSGMPGTGKSSLPPAIAECIGAQCRMVSVQPSWTDNQDLLGFYNPVQQSFVATPFLDILVEAKQNSDTVYLVCLDEMNLVHVEYYFSEILSAMESRDKTLHLYSRYAYDALQESLKQQRSALYKSSTSNGLVDIQESMRVPHNVQMLLDRYKADFELPDNVQFVGTLNKDETTKGLSPKVLDRSYIIEIDDWSQSGNLDVESTGGASLPEDVASFKMGAFRAKRRLFDEYKKEHPGPSLQSVPKKLDDLNEGLGDAEVRAALSARGRIHTERLLRGGLGTVDVYLGKILMPMTYMIKPEHEDLLKNEIRQAKDTLRKSDKQRTR